MTPEQAQLIPHIVSNGQWFVQLQGPLQAFEFAFVIVQFFRPLQDQPADTLQDRLMFFGQGALEPSPEIGQPLVEELDDMEVVKNDGRLGQIL